jgi:hypothetical protein
MPSPDKPRRERLYPVSAPLPRLESAVPSVVAAVAAVVAVVVGSQHVRLLYLWQKATSGETTAVQSLCRHVVARPMMRFSIVPMAANVQCWLHRVPAAANFEPAAERHEAT